MRKIRIILVILSVAGGIITVVHLASRDIPPLDATDLAIHRPAVPPEENGYTYFATAAEALYRPTDSSVVTDYLDGTPVPEEWILDLLARNGEMLEHMSRGLSCDICLSPEVTGFDSKLPHVAKWLDIGRVMAFKARSERLSGQTAQAVQSAVSLLRFAHLLQRDAESIMTCAVGIRVLELGLRQVRELAREKGTSTADLSRLSKALADLGPLDHGLARALKIEYRMAAHAVDGLAGGKYELEDLTALGGTAPPFLPKRKRMRGYFFQPNRTKAVLAQFYRDMIQNAPRLCSEVILPDPEAILGPRENPVRSMIRPNGVGRLLHAIMIPTLDSLFESKCRAESDVAATRLLTALRTYEREHGGFPERLEGLVPAFIGSLPSDRFDGEPFRYDPSMGLLDSVGKDWPL